MCQTQTTGKVFNLSAEIFKKEAGTFRFAAPIRVEAMQNDEVAV